MITAPTRLLMTADAVGGVWQYATELAEGLVRHGIDTTLAVLGPGPSESQRGECAALGVRLIETGLPLDWLSDRAGTVAAAKGIEALARGEGAEIVHLNSPALVAEARFAVPVIGVNHGCLSTWWEAARDEPLAPEFHWHHEMMAAGLRGCDRVIAPSQAYAETTRRHYRLPLAPKSVPNGRSRGIAARSRPMQDCVFTAGRLWDSVKNAVTLDRIAGRLRVPFHAAGPTEAPHGERVSLEHLHALGRIDQDALTRWLAARPVFVSAATFEPFGLAVLEAAASGCALVLSDIPTFRELWDGAALFHDPHDDAGFTRSIEDLIEDAPLRLRLGELARERARTYSAERMASAMAAHYRDVLSARSVA